MNLSRVRTEQSGFTLIELMVSMSLLMIVSGTVLSGILDMARVNEVVVNRTDMHSGVRNATELLTQEVGQAGRISLPDGIATTAGAAINDTTLSVTSTAQMFAGEQIIVDTAEDQETVTIVSVDSSTALTVSALLKDHVSNASVRVAGGFATGVVPPDMTDGSTGDVLKIYGDVNDDGEMVYVEYTCDIDDDGVGRLYRNSMPFDQVGKTAPSVEQILIDNIQTNPANADGTITPCFTYQTETVVGTTYVIDVAITLTVRTGRVDPITKQVQTETKALLNVSPRNVFNVWQIASLGITNRVQPMPQTVQSLLPDVVEVTQ